MATTVRVFERERERITDFILTHIVGDEKLESDRARKVFGDNYPRLQQIKKRYDPEVLFSKWFAIIPA